MKDGTVLIFDDKNCDLYQELNKDYQVLLSEDSNAFFKNVKENKEVNAYIIKDIYITKVFLYQLGEYINLEKSVVLGAYEGKLHVVIDDQISDYVDIRDFDFSYKRIQKYVALDHKIKRQRTKEADALNLITNVYHTTFSINLDTGEPSVIKIVDPVLERQIKTSNDASLWLNSYISAGNIHPDDLSAFVKVFNMKSLKEKFETGKRHIEQKYRRKINGAFKWQMMEMVASDSYTTNNPVVIFYERDLEQFEESSIDNVEQKISSVKVILLIDSSLANRNLLTNLLRDFNVLQASNHKSSFQVLNKYNSDIDLVILSAYDDYEAGIHYINEYKKKSYGNIPLLMIGHSDDAVLEKKAMDTGAFYYISKPINPIKFKSLIQNVIKMKENSFLVDQLKFDEKTKLYSQEYFFTIAENTIRNNPVTKFDMSVLEISNYRQILELYGPGRIDDLIAFISENINDAIKSSNLSMAGRCGTNSIVILCESRYKIYDLIYNDFTNEKFNDIITQKFNFTTFKAGVYKNIDTSLSIREDIERCRTAIDSVRDKYESDVAEFDNTYVNDVLKRQKIAECMEEAIQKEQFLVYYQPKHSLVTDKIIGAEALVRWVHPEFGFMNPSLFVPLFEENGFISRVDYYVWRKVCSTLNRWKSLNFPMIPVSINISRMDFYAFDVAKVITDLVKEYSIDPKFLHLEVTESAYVDDQKLVNDVVEKPHKEGFKIELDDFGVGYSNLTSFSEMTIDVMKLDMSFLKNETSKKDIVLKNMCELGNDLGLGVLCEGVETVEQKERLKKYGCQIAQGYLYSKPIPLLDFEEYIVRNI